MKTRMKQQLYNLLLTGLIYLLLPGELSGQGLRIVPREISVRNDSLHLSLSIDLNAVRVNSLTALTFTPLLADETHQLLLPPVVVTGTKRYRFERRERALSSASRPAPFRIIREGHKQTAKNIDYHVAVPYTSWMAQASLLLKQEIKDCCNQQLLDVDTLTGNMALNVSERPAAATQIATAPAGRQSAPVRILPLPDTTLATYIPMVSFLTPLLEKNGKQRTGKATLYIDYPLNKYDIFPDFRNNRHELNKIDSILSPLLDNGYTEIGKISIRGYASPDGPYKHNELLSSNRSQHFMNYVKNTYRLPERLFTVSSVAEDWDGLVSLLEQTGPPYKKEALNTIRRYGIFEGREAELMKLPGDIYKKMYRQLFPRLRRIEVAVDYSVARVETKDAAGLIYTHPEMLSLEEMYEVARYYRPGTIQYREVYEIAAFHFPQDIIANVNAASAVMLSGDLKSAWNYLRKAENDPRSWNNLGVLTLMEGNPEGACIWFRKAVGVEPEKARLNLRIAGQLLQGNE